MGLGVDLGTSFTAAAYADGPRITLLELEYDRTISPTAVFVRDDGALAFGHEAELAGKARPDRLLLNFKQDIGRTDPYVVGGRRIDVVDVAAAALKFVRDKARARITGFGDDTPTTITAPAVFGASGPRIDALRDAARKAGFRPDRTFVTPEPVAASIGFQSGAWPKPDFDRNAVLLVYDLGGGTFDAAAVRLSGKGNELFGVPVGDGSIGGARFDRALLDALAKEAGEDVAEKFRRPFDDAEMDAWRARMNEALRVCREVKERSSTAGDTTITLPGAPSMMTVTAAGLEAIVTPFIVTTSALMARLAHEVAEDGHAIAGVLMVGGSCRMPIVARVLAEKLGAPLYAAPDPARIVALGAAIDARRRAGDSGRDERRGAGERDSLMGAFFKKSST